MSFYSVEMYRRFLTENLFLDDSYNASQWLPLHVKKTYKVKTK